MKKILTLATLSLTCITINAQSMDIALTPRQQVLAAIAALEAKGDQAGLETAVAEALDNGLTGRPLRLHSRSQGSTLPSIRMYRKERRRTSPRDV